ncbi:MAG: hypothetical protein GEV11_20375 [Streptosporangiales bacterium]|nr:hypothetical protein [Streptosporangiales bacterium]
MEATAATRSPRCARSGTTYPVRNRDPKPVIAAVDGPAYGMGAEFTVQADLRIASTRARFA